MKEFNDLFKLARGNRQSLVEVVVQSLMQVRARRGERGAREGGKVHSCFACRSCYNIDH